MSCPIEEDKDTNYAKSVANVVTNRRKYYVQLPLVSYFCDVLYFLNALGQLLFMDYIFGYEMSNGIMFGFAFLSKMPKDRTDGLHSIFPLVTKCHMESFGYSGTVQVQDAICLLPQNVMYEYIYVVMWIWMLFLTFATFVSLIWTLLAALSHRIRTFRINKVSLKTNMTQLI